MRIFYILIFIVVSLYAQSNKLSHIPPTKNIFIDLDENACQEECLQELIKNEKIFSFLSKYNNIETNENIQNEFYNYSAMFRLLKDEKSSIRLAILIPQKSIRRYALTTVNSIIAYMLSKRLNFEIKVFNSVSEDSKALLSSIKEIKAQNFQYVIAPLTKKGADIMIENSKNLLVYIPTINKNEYTDLTSNIIFGGINYKKQIKKLLPYTNKHIALFSDGSNLSKSLDKVIRDEVPKIRYAKTINKSRINFKKILRRNKKIDNSSIFLNTPLVKTSLIASQFRVHNKTPYSLLSTQINYNPLLLTLTQYEDRKKLYIANSIGESPINLRETNSLFGHNITYDWVNYSTSIGIDYIYTHYLSPSSAREFKESIVDNQVQYDISILKANRYKFDKELF